MKSAIFLTNIMITEINLVLIQIDGDKNIAQEVLAQVKLWDQALIGANICELINQCSPEMRMFDVSCQLDSIDAYKTEWEKFSPYFMEGMRIFRREMKLHASEKFAILHCLSKVANNTLKNELEMPWCRTTLCLKKIDDQWRIIHQHISLPVDMVTGKVLLMEEKPKYLLI